MTRKEYLMRQKEEKGRKLFGIFPAYYPKEILWAMNVLPVEVWDPPLEVNHANAHLQPYICSVVKLGLVAYIARQMQGYRLASCSLTPVTLSRIWPLLCLIT